MRVCLMDGKLYLKRFHFLTALPEGDAQVLEGSSRMPLQDMLDVLALSEPTRVMDVPLPVRQEEKGRTSLVLLLPDGSVHAWLLPQDTGALSMHREACLPTDYGADGQPEGLREVVGVTELQPGELVLVARYGRPGQVRYQLVLLSASRPVAVTNLRADAVEAAPVMTGFPLLFRVQCGDERPRLCRVELHNMQRSRRAVHAPVLCDYATGAMLQHAA